MAGRQDRLVAITMTGPRYLVAGTLRASLDCAALVRDGLLHGVTDDPEFADEAAILHRAQVANYLLPAPEPGRGAVEDWLSALPKEVRLVLYHRVAFKEGLTDQRRGEGLWTVGLCAVPLQEVGVASTQSPAPLGARVCTGQRGVFIVATRALAPIVEVTVNAFALGRPVAGCEGQPRRRDGQQALALK